MKLHENLRCTHCTYCGSYEIRMSQHRWWDAAAGWLKLDPYRCLRCGTRFFRAREIQSLMFAQRRSH